MNGKKKKVAANIGFKKGGGIQILPESKLIAEVLNPKPVELIISPFDLAQPRTDDELDAMFNAMPDYDENEPLILYID